jgi:elongation factor Tu
VAIARRSLTLTPQVERGVITKGAEVELIGFDMGFKTTITGIEMFHKELDRGEAGDNMGALLRGIKREQVRRGMVIAIPGTIKPVRKFVASVYVSRSRLLFSV